jgi:hypothetical protein
LRITFVRNNTNAVGEYRSRHPALALQALGHECRLLTLGLEAERVAAAEIAGDVLVLGRITHPSILQLRDAIPPEHRPLLVYELDDNPWEWHSWDPVHVAHGAAYAAGVRRMLAHCAAVICSTATLAARVRQETGLPVWVCPNAIDYQLRDWEQKEDRAAHGLAGKTVLGWTGSIHHQRDAGALLPALPAVFDAYPDTVFLMACDKSVYDAWTGPLQAAWGDRLRWAPPVAFADHPRIYSLFDINLAPLENTRFNLCKSDLRLIEGGAHGVPYVASALAPYAEFHRLSGGVGGFLATTVHEWEDGIEALLDGQREARGQSLARYVRETRALSVVAGQWETALSGALLGVQGQRVTERPAPRRNDLCPCDSGRKYKRCCVPIYGAA